MLILVHVCLVKNVALLKPLGYACVRPRVCVWGRPDSHSSLCLSWDLFSLLSSFHLLFAGRREFQELARCSTRALAVLSFTAGFRTHWIAQSWQQGRGKLSFNEEFTKNTHLWVFAFLPHPVS